jgi:hypothetical protein
MYERESRGSRHRAGADPGVRIETKKKHAFSRDDSPGLMCTVVATPARPQAVRTASHGWAECCSCACCWALDCHASHRGSLGRNHELGTLSVQDRGESVVDPEVITAACGDLDWPAWHGDCPLGRLERRWTPSDQLSADLQLRLNVLTAHCGPIRTLRNRKLAHTDLPTRLNPDVEPVPEVQRKLIQDALGQIAIAWTASTGISAWPGYPGRRSDGPIAEQDLRGGRPVKGSNNGWRLSCRLR